MNVHHATACGPQSFELRSKDTGYKGTVSVTVPGLVSATGELRRWVTLAKPGHLSALPAGLTGHWVWKEQEISVEVSADPGGLGQAHFTFTEPSGKAHTCSGSPKAACDAVRISLFGLGGASVSG